MFCASQSPVIPAIKLSSDCWFSELVVEFACAFALQG